MPRKVIIAGGMKLLPADIIFCKVGENWLGRSIAWFTQAKGEDPTYAVHVSMVGLKYDVIEADWTARAMEWKEWSKGRSFEVWRFNGLLKEERETIASDAEWFVDRKIPYGWWEIIHQAADGLLSKVVGGDRFFFRRLTKLDPDNPICSQLISFPYARKNILFGLKDPEYANPDELMDYCQGHLDEWAMVYGQ